MIDPKDALQAGFVVQDIGALFSIEKASKLEAIKQILPAAINADGVLNNQALKDVLGVDNVTANNQGYELTFAGKGLAKAAAELPTAFELRLESSQSKNRAATENVIIRGDNMDALKILRQNYTDKIKMIYIDPPYNTANDNFIYKDNFKQSEAELIDNLKLQDDMVDYLHSIYGTKTHSGWLAFMYPRLKLARDLLSDDGVIFISIDDNELANLKIICDEIFGEENFVGSFIWHTKQAARGVPPVSMLMSNHEHVLAYQKRTFIFRGEKRNVEDFSNKDNDPRGLWRNESIKATGKQNNYFIIKNPETENEFYGNWAFSKNRIEEMIQEKLILFPKNKTGTPRQKKFINSYKNKNKAVISHLGWFSTEKATKNFMDLFESKKVFDFPKPLDLIKFLVTQSCINDSLILDFFAGSGTTADAVMQLNAEDGGSRQFILVQLDETIDPKSSKPAHDFCTDNNLDPVISSICIERINRAGDKIITEQTAAKNLLSKDRDLDIGYKVFSLHPRPKIVATEIGQAEFVIDRSVLDTLYNMLAASGKILTHPIEVLEPDKLYKIDDAYYLLGQCQQDLSEVQAQIYIDGYAEISLEKWLNTLGINNKDVAILY